MASPKSTKRKVAALIPWRRTEGEVEFFLQKRSADAPSNAGLYGLFGGGIEGREDKEAGVLREIQEELCYTPQNLVYFSRFEHSSEISYVFVEEVDSLFESRVTVLEGDYGVFLRPEQLLYNKEVTLMAQCSIDCFITEILEQSAPGQ